MEEGRDGNEERLDPFLCRRRHRQLKQTKSEKVRKNDMCVYVVMERQLLFFFGGHDDLFMTGENTNVKQR